MIQVGKLVVPRSALDRCPRCRKFTLRAKVNLFLDIPVRLSHQLSKDRLRSREVKVDGAGWTNAMWYCENVRCSFILRMDGPEDQPGWKLLARVGRKPKRKSRRRCPHCRETFVLKRGKFPKHTADCDGPGFPYDCPWSNKKPR